MKLKMLVLAVATTFATISAPSVMACSTDAWSSGAGVTGSPVAGQPTDTTLTRRYSGVCGLRAPAAGSFVTDITPNLEEVFRARFYVYTGVTGGNAVVFRAANASDAPMITVTYDAAAASFGFATTAVGGASVGSIVANRWYSIELTWARQGATVPSGVTAGVMTATVQGAGAATATTATGTLTVGTSDRIDAVQLGWISGAAVAAPPDALGFPGGIVVDAYESRRATAIPRLCRGDANASNNPTDGSNPVNVGDRAAVTNELLRGVPSPTIPDCNEDGLITTGDRACITNIILNRSGSCQ